ncbi:GNAT family N-acetyltransferase [Brevibacillus sp. B_LB10_24]|uniref:GNAT family N-acetyltransferase n=1 Tax=Brevibacillus sp. B_LB10_24 TaxID=3380645 RepID=UPI0038B80F43
MPRILGKRIVLREYMQEDLPHMREWVNDPEIVNQLSDIFLYPQTLNDTEGFLQAMLEKRGEQRGFVIAHKDTAAYIGQIDLHQIDWKNRVAEMGIVIGRACDQGKGYGSEAVRLLQGFVFERLNLHKLELKVHDFNAQAYHCYLKCGFREEGRIRQKYYLNGTYHDVIYMGILKTEYEAMKE